MAYSVKVTKFSTSERFVHLIVPETQLPHFQSTIYNLAMLRGRQLATSTIEQTLRAIKIFLLFCDMHGISLSTRMQNGFIFQAGELDELLRLCRKPLEHIQAMAVASKSSSSVSSSKRLRFFPRTKSEDEVSTEWIENRIIYIRDYIDWLASTQCDRFLPRHEHYLLLADQRKSVYNKLTASLPASKGRNVVNQRMGLNEEQQAILLKLIDHTSPDNVWVGHHCRVRNELMIRMFIKLGVRRGELAGISVRDIDFRARTLLIRRRADDKADPRVNQPNAKTRDRILPLSEDLAWRIHILLSKLPIFQTGRQSSYPLLTNVCWPCMAKVRNGSIADATIRLLPAKGRHTQRKLFMNDFDYFLTVIGPWINKFFDGT